MQGWTDEIAYVLDSTPVAAVEQRDLCVADATPRHATPPPRLAPARRGSPAAVRAALFLAEARACGALGGGVQV